MVPHFIELLNSRNLNCLWNFKRCTFLDSNRKSEIKINLTWSIADTLLLPYGICCGIWGIWILHLIVHLYIICQDRIRSVIYVQPLLSPRLPYPILTCTGRLEGAWREVVCWCMALWAGEKAFTSYWWWFSSGAEACKYFICSGFQLDLHSEKDGSETIDIVFSSDFWCIVEHSWFSKISRIFEVIDNTTSFLKDLLNHGEQFLKTWNNWRVICTFTKVVVPKY